MLLHHFSSELHDRQPPRPPPLGHHRRKSALDSTYYISPPPDTHLFLHSTTIAPSLQPPRQLDQLMDFTTSSTPNSFTSTIPLPPTYFNFSFNTNFNFNFNSKFNSNSKFNYTHQSRIMMITNRRDEKWRGVSMVAQGSEPSGDETRCGRWRRVKEERDEGT